MRLGVIGLNKANLAELLGAEDRAQNRWVEMRGDLDPLAHIVDADTAMLAADLGSDYPATRQEVGITLLKQVELRVPDDLANLHVRMITIKAMADTA
jgi:hypothetical protein